MAQRRNRRTKSRRRAIKRSRRATKRSQTRRRSIQKGGYFYFSNPPFGSAITSYAGPQSQDAPRLMTIEDTYDVINSDV